MNTTIQLIQGNRHTDHRGTVTFLNDFDMSEVRRFYIIQNQDTETVRAWRAHKIEKRWFYVSDGAFLIRIVNIDNWETPDKNSPIDDVILSAQQNQILYIPVGHGTWIQATEDNSKLIVFGDHEIGKASLDDHLYPSNYFESKNNIQ